MGLGRAHPPAHPQRPYRPRTTTLSLNTPLLTNLAAPGVAIPAESPDLKQLRGLDEARQLRLGHVHLAVIHELNDGPQVLGAGVLQEEHWVLTRVLLDRNKSKHSEYVKGRSWTIEASEKSGMFKVEICFQTHYLISDNAIINHKC